MPLLPRLAVIFLVLLASACAADSSRSHGVVHTAQGPAPAELAAAERAVAGGDAAGAERVLAAIDFDALDELGVLRYRAVQAAILLSRGEGAYALRMLPPPGSAGDRVVDAHIEGLRGACLFQVGDVAAAVQVLVAREQLLEGSELEANRERLWLGLMQAAPGALQEGAERSDGAAVAWIELAMIVRNMLAGTQDELLADWRVRHSDHPADIARISGWGRAPAVTQAVPRLGSEADMVALLLPLAGTYAAQAEAVRDGFLAAWYDDSAQGRPAVRIYDAGLDEQSLLAAWQSALNDGAGLVVGPLRRDMVTALARQGQPAVPVLALNYLDANTRAPANFYQWGLAPEDEAREAAEHAWRANLQQAIALVPDGDWGDRVYNAFRARLEQLGGKVLEVQRFPSALRDYTAQIRALLDLDASEGRNKALRGILGVGLEFYPRRRSDADFIFIGARSDQARLIRPQLRYHRAGDLPAYATSLVYDGGRQSEDLAGIRFCDQPWMIEDGQWGQRRTELRAALPARSFAQPRLVALGYDAWRLVRSLQRGALRRDSALQGASGALSLGSNNAINRSLGCVEIGNGGLRPIGAATTVQR